MRRLLAALLVTGIMGVALFAAAALTNQVKINVEGDFRFIESNGYPDHQPGQFPNRGNPNSIRAQHYKYRIPVAPKAATQVTPLRMSPFGVALNGVPFDPGTAEFWNNNPDSGWRFEALSGKISLGLDKSNAHVQPSGAYHYHGLPMGLIQKLTRDKRGMILVGYAADGFPIYESNGYADPDDPESKLKALKSSYRLKSGTRPTGPRGKYDGTFVEDWEYVAGAGDLDECNGRSGVTPEYPDGTYYYVVTAEFPFIPRNYRGTPDASFQRHGPPGGGGRGGRPPGPPGRRPPPGRFPPPGQGRPPAPPDGPAL